MAGTVGEEGGEGSWRWRGGCGVERLHAAAAAAEAGGKQTSNEQAGMRNTLGRAVGRSEMSSWAAEMSRTRDLL